MAAADEIDGADGEDDQIDESSPGKYRPPSTLEDDQLFRVLKGWWSIDDQHRSVWAKDAVRWRKFRSGEQWDTTDKALLDSQSRPAIVFNRTLTVLKAVEGMEINGRHEITFLPRNTQDTAVNELLSAASKWMADGCDAEDEESAAFSDLATVGMGWAENRMDYTEEWNGKYIEEHVNPLEMRWDYSARKKNLTDARRLHRTRKMALYDAMQMFPDIDREDLDAAWAEDAGGDSEPTKSLEQKRQRDENTPDTFDDKNRVTIVHMQWEERVWYWKVANLQNNTKVDLTDDQYETLQKRMKLLGAEKYIKAVRLPKKVYKAAFLGRILLEKKESPLKNQFSWKCMTGEQDQEHNSWFGLVKIMVDPQMWSNKWLSQVLHIMNTTAKGGILAEEDVFEGSQQQFEENYAKPDAVTWVKKGAIANKTIMEKPGKGLSGDYVGLMQYAVSSIRDVTGINLELLGQQDQNQPGILEAYRKQAGMTILATLFDSLRRFRKQTGRCRLYFIQNYLSDGRLIRVTDPDDQTKQKALPLLKDKCLGEYDTIVDDTPTSPNQKEANWAIIQPMLAVFKDQLVSNPEVLVALLEYSPLPSRVVEMLRKFAQDAKDNPEQQQMKNLNINRLLAMINKDQSAAELNNSKAGATEATAIYDVAMARNLLTKNEDVDTVGKHLEHLQALANIQKTSADTQHTAAKIGGENAGVLHKLAAARAAHVDATVAGRTPIEGTGEKVVGGADSLHPVQRRMPPGARRAKDGNWYILDRARPGRYLRIEHHAA